jgi:D-alanyl-D-alanine carboxypeptidase (penicillin-binding protein 5/6)
MYQKDGHRLLPPASLTKIATAILTVEAGGLDAWVRTDVDSDLLARETDSSVMGLRPGDCFRVRDLLYGLMLPSGNDAALALGRQVAGNDETFVARMNALVARIGLTETTYRNAHGLPAPGHLTSAYDLAMLARYAMTLPDFVATVGLRQRTIQGSRTIALTNTNTLLGVYQGTDGVKTGYTEEAGRTMVVSATRNGHRVFVALLNAPDRDEDAMKLLDWAFTNVVFG